MGKRLGEMIGGEIAGSEIAGRKIAGSEIAVSYTHLTGAATVILAMEAGRAGARGIDEYLNGNK